MIIKKKADKTEAPKVYNNDPKGLVWDKTILVPSGKYAGLTTLQIEEIDISYGQWMARECIWVQ